jgi:VWFA-related protein
MRLPYPQVSAAVSGCFLLSAVVLGQRVDVPTSAEEPISQPAVTFRARADVVEIDAVVTDGHNEPVAGLTPEDFEILQDGKPQAIALFTAVRLAMDLPAPQNSAAGSGGAAKHRRPAVDVRSNSHAFEGRVYLLVLDDLHVNALHSHQARSAAKDFISRYVDERDLAAVVSTSGRTDATQELTNDQQLLLAAIDRFQGRKLESVTESSAREYFLRREMPNPGRDPDKPLHVDDPRALERARQSMDTLRSVRALVEWFANVRGRRKSVLLFSEGLDFDVANLANLQHANGRPRSGAAVDQATRDLIATATRENVNIYSIDPSGLLALDEVAGELHLGPLPDDTGVVELGAGSLQSETRIAQNTLRTFAESTGGFAAIGLNDLSAAFQRIARENSVYYVLGFHAPDQYRDGRFHAIDVRVRRPGLRVQARKGYVAAAAATKPAGVGPTRSDRDAVREAIESPLSWPGLSLRAVAAPFKGPRRDASVPFVLHVDGRNITFSEHDGIFQDDIEVVVVAFDSSGKTAARDRQVANMRLKPETHEAVSRMGFRVISRLDLPAGRYQIRAVVRETGGGRIGSVRYDLDVPDFSTALSISGVLVTSARAVLTPTLRPDERLDRVLPAPPTTDREFVRGDTVALFAELYAKDERQVVMTTELVDDSGGAIFRTSEERLSIGRGGRMPYGVQVPLAAVPDGSYVLRLTGRAGPTNEPVIRREIPLTVVAATR